MKNLSLSIFVCFCFVLSISAQQNASAISFVPDKSVAVLRVNWTIVRDDESLRNIVKGDDFANLINQFGLNESKLSEWIVFSDINPASSSGMGMIVSGNFTSQNISQNVEANKWNRQMLNQQNVYVNPTDNSYLLPVRNGLFVVGTKAGVEKAQHAFANPQNRLSGKHSFSSLFGQLGNAAPIKFFMGVPQDYQKAADFAFKIATKLMSFTGFSLLGTVFDKIGLIQNLGFSVSKGKDNFPVQLVAMMPDATRAEIGASALNLIKNLPKWMNNNQSQETAALQSMIINSSGKTLSVKFNMTKSISAQR